MNSESQEASAPAAATVVLPAQPAAVERGFLRLGEFNDAARHIGVNSRYLERQGQPWLPVMGEFHYSRYPASEWETELRRMHAGGVDVVASYVLWNHHEYPEGCFDWSGQRDLRRFVQLVHQVGMAFYLRPGPWVHSEARNGGFPDWLLPSQPGNGPVRCNDAQYLARVARLFGQIGAQLQGLMWADGGPVLGLQLENEYDGSGPGKGAEHIAELKRLAIEAGLRVPVYTVTGWPTLDIPPREVLPVSGAYPDGFWQGDLGPLPPSGVFLFNTERAIGEMGNVGGTPAQGLIDKTHYPFFLAEAGGGMQVSYHRRPVVQADDVAATALVQLGSGATLYGYYMYHGGSNPSSPAGRLQETQASGYPNDVPVLGYDFRAPLGQYGQERASYGRLRCLHLFMRAFGAQLAGMEAVLPANAPRRADDAQALRVALRGAGESGFVFVNHHVRHHPLPQRQNFQVEVMVQEQEREHGQAQAQEPQPQLHSPAAGARRVQRLPAKPMTLASGAYFIWPVGQRIGAACLHQASLQPLTRFAEGQRQTWALFSLPGVPAELCFEARSVLSVHGLREQDVQRRKGEQLWLRLAELEALLPLTLVDASGQAHTLMLMPQRLADRCAQLPILGRQRLVWSAHGAFEQAGQLVLRVPEHEAQHISLFPADDLVHSGAGALAHYHLPAQAPALPALVPELRRPAQAAPALRFGPHIGWRQRAVPLAPDDAEFDAAALELALPLPPELQTAPGRVLLALDYLGDAARLYADGVLVDDHFFDGQPWYVGLDRLRAEDGCWPELSLRILPARLEAPIFLEALARQRLASAQGQAQLLSAQAVAWVQRSLNLVDRCGQPSPELCTGG